MSTRISKSEFKARALEILRAVEETGEPVIITDRGKATVEVRPYREKPHDAAERLKGSVLYYHEPLEPAGVRWEALE